MANAPALSFNIEAGELAAAASNSKGRRWVECMLCTIGLATATMSSASAIYKAPAGIFSGHSCAYYVSVASASVVGLAEACAAAVWLSAAAADDDGPRQGQQQQQRLVRRCVLCASFLPLAFMAGLGGVRILVK